MSFHPALTLTTSDAPPSAAGAEPEGLRALRREYESKLRRAHETILSLDNLLAPQDWLDAGAGFGPLGWRLNRPAQRTQDRTHGPLSYLSEEEWRQHVALARDLCTRNHLALGFRDHVSNFIGPVQISFVLAGANPGATSTGPRDANGDGEPDVCPLVSACMRVWEEWCEFAEWGQGEDDREEECRRRLLVEGEATVRFFVGDEESGGLPYVRHLEPELIRTPPGSSTIDPEGWGVVTAPEDDEREEGLWVCRAENVSEGRLIGSGEYVRVKGNVDRTVKRGLSDFFPVGEQLRKVLGLLDNMAHVARVQAAIAWWEQYPAATLDQVSTQVRLGADYQRVKLPPTSVGASVDVTSYEAGTVVRTEGGREVRPGPVSAPNGFEAVERMVLRSVGFRWGCPSYFSGEGDASFASVLVTGSPFVRITEVRQERAKAFGCRVASKVLELCERSGRLPLGVSRRVRPVGVCRPVVIADEEKKARTFLSLYGQNCADPVEFVRSTGADPKVVAANIRAWKKKFDPPDPQTGPGEDGVVGGGEQPETAPTDPESAGAGDKPTPPGNAGGDGSSANDDPLDDAVTEAAKKPTAGVGLQSVVVTVHPKNGKPYQRKQKVRPKGSSAGQGGGARSPTKGGTAASGLQPRQSPPNAHQLSDAKRHAVVKQLIQPSGPKPSGKDEQREWMHKHLRTLHTDDLRLIMHHNAQGDRGRAVHKWAWAANEVFQNRLTGGQLTSRNNPGWDSETKSELINHKLLTGANNGNKDGFKAGDVDTVMTARENGKSHLPFARTTLVQIKDDANGNNGLYVYPGFTQGTYTPQKAGGGPPYLILSEAELNRRLAQPGGEEGVRKFVRQALTKHVSGVKAREAVLREMGNADEKSTTSKLEHYIDGRQRAAKRDPKSRKRMAKEFTSKMPAGDLGIQADVMSDAQWLTIMKQKPALKARLNRLSRRKSR